MISDSFAHTTIEPVSDLMINVDNMIEIIEPRVPGRLALGRLR
jgi:hypothetical protein